MQSTRLSLKSAGLAIVVSLLLACRGGGAPAAPTASNAPIVVGGTLGLTGAYSGPSAVYKAVYQYWVDNVNSRGGLLGRQVKLTIYDDESTPATAQTLYQKLIRDDKADLLLAPYTTQVGGPVVSLADSNRKVLWNGGFVGIEFFQKSNWMVGAYTFQEPNLPTGIFDFVDSLPPDQKPQRLGVLTEANPFTTVERDGYNGQGGALQLAQQHHLELVFNEEYQANTSDFSGLIQRAKAANVDFLLALALPNPASSIAKAVNQQAFRPKIFCACGSQVATLPTWPDLGAAGSGVFSTQAALPSDKYPGTAELAQVLQQQLGYKELPSYAVTGYTILQILEGAVNGAKTLDQQQLREYVLKNSFDTASGKLKFDEHGIPNYNMALVQVQSGNAVIVWPSDRATGKAVIPLQQ